MNEKIIDKCDKIIEALSKKERERSKIYNSLMEKAEEVFSITNKIPYNLDDPGTFDIIYDMYPIIGEEYDDEEVFTMQLFHTLLQIIYNGDFPDKMLRDVLVQVIELKVHVVSITEHMR